MVAWLPATFSLRPGRGKRDRPCPPHDFPTFPGPCPRVHGLRPADDSFTKGLTPADFQAAGLGKLTPEELAKLDALVEGKQTGAVVQAKEETAKVVTETVRKQVQEEDKKAEQEKKKKEASAGILTRLKVVLKPAPTSSTPRLDAMLAPPFNGWGKGTYLNLTNGQIWVVTDDGHYQTAPITAPVPVRITPGPWEASS